VASPRPLGRTGLVVSPLAISGANEPSVASLFAAANAGCNLFFWEPRYRNLSTFLRASARRGEAPLVVAGTYHATERAIRKDIERALRSLQRDRIDVFLIFWTRSPARLAGDVPRALERAKREGLIGAAGFSTHDRALAEHALEGGSSPWEVIMVRHSAAHPGAENSLFPAAARAGVGVLGFSATSYGRLLRPVAAPHGPASSSVAASAKVSTATPASPALPTAAECYKYTLSQPGVTACVSAPRGGVELMNNLAVLADPTLRSERIAELRAHGQALRQESVEFNRHVRRFPAAPEDLEQGIDEALARIDEGSVAGDGLFS
jgi:aryl-alcohol dehydrogenase-like predicted oxidoreductase